MLENNPLLINQNRCSSHIRYPVLYHRNENKDVSEIRLVSLWGSLLE